MKKQLADLQGSFDKRMVTIDKVGVKGIQYPIIVEDRSKTTQHTIADLDIYVELPHESRGTHMSRFIEILNKYHEETLIPKLPEFLSDLKSELHANASYIKLQFPYFVRKIAPVSGIESLLGYDCIFEASLLEQYELVIGVIVPITTLCPCSKEISEYGAHNQRSLVTVKITYSDFVWLEEIIDKVEEVASCEIYPALKRVDEKYVTERAFDNPMFVEDIVREITLKLRADKRVTSFYVESDNYESIHNHNAYACVKEIKG
ncbi:MAG TPA: GTP cyclohydrolase FolE2 [Candidatus Cloacimonadota bacterium]|nr:GTP cyclohydrolase FolE2 [Candidatus Cloacimonadota bacterium]HPT73036.1 GTP cyclohydrolase FolE2 [Candidatus Cloacimonadota bacterium]